ncbi:beta-barrel assembly-enhancing protease [mine drainage metagenome]|uniref:Beta-barrel assembly-enhancing protease n=1 Tax=mine drainage metagenome TaxID=410659 RepID=A0A1J5QLQ6_9ZZZZ
MTDATSACRQRPTAARIAPRMTPFRLAPVLLGLAMACVGLVPLATSAHADELGQVRALASGGHIAQAQSKLDGLIAAHPHDPQYRFLRGVLLSEQNKTAEAIQTFTQITEQFPELPEPYNNLAVLYAQQGNYDKARAALEMAIRTNPSYATAFENLGDVYAKLASQSYQKALQLDGGGANGTQAKLALIRQLFEAENKRVSSGSAAAAPTAAPAPAAKPAPVAKPAPAMPAPVAKPAPATPTPVAKPAPAAPTQVAKASPSAATAPGLKPAPAHETVASAAAHTTPPAVDAERAVEHAVLAWAHAWQSRDLHEYFASYAHDFAPGGLSHAAWMAQRKARIADKRHITVEVDQLRVQVDGDRATARFRQLYSAGSLHFNSPKTLRLRRVGAHWLIVQETVG